MNGTKLDLRPVQKKVLQAMFDMEPVAFVGDGSRRLGFGLIATPKGMVIRAFQGPQWPLMRRGLIEECPRRKGWWRLTDAGRAAVRRMRGSYAARAQAAA